MYGFTKDQVPPPYEKITWEDKFERTSRDYGAPTNNTKPDKWIGFDANSIEGDLAAAELADAEDKLEETKLDLI